MVTVIPSAFFVARGSGRGRKQRLLLSATALACISALEAGAQTTCGGGAGAPVGGICQLPVFDPTLNDGPANPGLTQVSGGATITLQGLGTQIATGVSGYGVVGISTLYANGQVVTGQQFANPANPASLVVTVGGRSLSVIVPDPITGGTRTVPVYNNVAISDSFASYQTIANFAVNGQQYINTRIGAVDSTGGTLNVNIGNGGATTASENQVRLIAKQSYLFTADGTAGNSSEIVWQSRNFVDMGAVATATQSTSETSSFTNLFAAYTGGFTAFDGSAWTVGNAAQLQAYNSFLITSLQSGALAPERYESEFNRAYTRADQTITYLNGPANLNDEAFQPIGSRAVIYAVGANARGTVAPGAAIEASTAGLDARIGADRSLPGTIMLADQGATITNNGTLSTRRTGNDFLYAMMARDGSHAINDGVINIGFLPGTTPIVLTQHYGMSANGAGSEAINNGVINIGGATSQGVILNTQASGSNSGSINVGVPDTLINSFAPSYGVFVGSSTFVNTATGTIYLGRGAQQSPADVVPDASTGALPLNGIWIRGTGTTTNAGTITIGTQTQGSNGIFIDGGNAAVSNAATGVINVNGAAGAAPLENRGIYALNALNVTNAGTINVAGTNGIGIKVAGTTPTSTSRATSSGTIVVAGGIGPTGLRNYGIWSEGGASVATLSGEVDLTGTGGIGVHARGGGRVNITGTGSVSFDAGSNQIGYFAHGVGSTITNAGAASQDVSTPNSVLFRIEDGASFTGNGENLTASGAGTRLIVGTGVLGADRAVVDTADARLLLTGQAATGVQIDGGAQGFLRAQTQVQLSGVASVGGLVDGRKYNLDGTISPPVPTPSELTNEAAITSSTQDVVGFITQFGGRLVNEGVINLTNGVNNTGIIARSGGVLDNRQNVTVAHGTGILVEGAGAASQLANRATVTAQDGIAALHIRDGAFLTADSSTGTLVGGGTAHGVLIGQNAAGAVLGANTVMTTGSGNGVENAAEIGNVGFAGTTIRASGTSSGIRTATSLAATLADGSPSTVAIDVSGSGAGLDFRQAGDPASPLMAAGDLAVGPGYTINADGGAIGIRALTSGQVATAATVSAGAGGGPALLAGTAASSTNLGTLSSLNAAMPVVDLSNGTGTTFTNQGTVSAVDAATPAIHGSAGNDVVNLGAGSVRGIVATGDGTDVVHWTGGSLNGSIEMGAGSNDSLTISAVDLATTYHLDGGPGAGDTLTFDGVRHRGASLAADDLSQGVNLGQGWETINLRNGTNFGLTGNLVLGGSTLNIDASSQLNAGGGVLPQIRSALANDPVTVNNAGTIDLTTGSSGPTDRLTIVGNYVGQNGRLAVDSVLNEGMPNSVSDKLVIDGGNGPARASGVTALTVRYQGGGALTTGDGIQVVQAANGAATDAGAFVLGNRVAAGAYEYELHRGGRADTGGNPNDQNWYLRDTTEVTIEPEPPPPAPPVVEVPNYRREVPLDMAVPAMVNRLGLAMLGTYHDRVGEDYGDALSPAKPLAEGERPAWGWGRVFGQSGDVKYGRNGLGRFNSFLGNGPSYDYQVVGLQAGMDLLRRPVDEGMRDTAGFYASVGRIESDVESVLSSIKAGSASVNGVSIGGYWTRKGTSGWYMDGVVQATRYDSIRTHSTAGETLDTTGWGGAASIEGGYPLAFGEGWAIEPQAQLIYQHNSIGDTQRDRFGLISYEDTDAAYGRLGARLTKNWTTDGGRPATAWARINIWHNLGSDAKTTFSTLGGLYPVTLGTSLGGTWGQIGVGMAAQVSKSLSMFGSIDYDTALGQGKGSGVSARGGLKVVW